MDTIKLTLPANQEYVILARLTIASVANGMGFSIGDVEDLKMALTEACTNAISHSTVSEATYDLTCLVGEKDLRITVTDTGLGFETHTVKLPGESDVPVGSGFGLFIIKTLMDTIEITSQKGVGTTIVMVKNLPVDK